MRQYRAIPIGGKDFVYGWYVERNGHATIYPLDPYQKGHYAVIPETVGQSTGLKDKNGKKIYSGDRIKQAGHIIGGTKIEEGNVEQASNGRYFVRLMWEGGMECHADIAEDAEIVGNIFDNATE